MSEGGDDYLRPGLAEPVLRNTFNIDNNAELSEVERTVSRAAAVRLDHDPVPATFDRDHLTALHHALFSKVYPWAGHMRDEKFQLPDGAVINPMRGLSKGDKSFAPTYEVGGMIHDLNQTIEQAGRYQNLPPAQFSERAAEVLSELNHIHPFREGNGRTQRAFLSDLGREAGHEIDWTGIDRLRNLEASKATDVGHLQPMRDMMRDAIQPERQTLLQEAGRALANNPDLGWLNKLDGMGELKQQTLLPGQTVSGSLYAVSGTAALIVDGGNTLHVARASDLPDGVAPPSEAEQAASVTITGSESHQDRVWAIDLEQQREASSHPQSREEWLESSRALIERVPDGPKKDEMLAKLDEVEASYEVGPTQEDGFDLER